MFAWEVAAARLPPMTAISAAVFIPLFARRDFPRRHAEFIDVPIADDHLDRGQHFLSLGVAVPLGSQALNLKLNCCIDSG